jgi:uncharacterized protein involved in exopolysaccharide biosynthesis
MELYEYFLILRNKQRVFWMTLGIIVFVALVWQGNQDNRFGATLLLNISRSGSQQTSDYTYDGFYRLQADERFADTVVRWIGSPRGTEDVLHEAGIGTESLRTKDLTGFFTVGRLSSQVIRVEYTRGDSESTEKIAGALVKTLNRYADELNRDARDPSWFMIIGNDPVIRDARVSLEKVFAMSVAVGIFLGLFFSLFSHYWEVQKTRNREQ